MLPLLSSPSSTLSQKANRPEEGGSSMSFKHASQLNANWEAQRVQWANKSHTGLMSRGSADQAEWKERLMSRKSNRRKRWSEEARVWVSLARAGSTLISSGMASSREKGICHCTVRMEGRMSWLPWIMAEMSGSGNWRRSIGNTTGLNKEVATMEHKLRSVN